MGKVVPDRRLVPLEGVSVGFLYPAALQSGI